MYAEFRHTQVKAMYTGIRMYFRPPRRVNEKAFINPAQFLYTSAATRLKAGAYGTGPGSALPYEGRPRF